jgi:hypothetical protein
MAMTCFSETSVDFLQTTRRYIAEDTTLQSYQLCARLSFQNNTEIWMERRPVSSNKEEEEKEVSFKTSKITLSS